MKPIQIHPLSAILGATVAVVVVLTIGAQVQGPLFKVVPDPPIRIRVDGVPAPDQLVRITEGELFVVPQGKVLVITGVAITDAIGVGSSVLRYNIVVNGTKAIGGVLSTAPGFTDVLFWGYRVDEGSTVEIDDDVDGAVPPAEAIILGYLAEA